MFIFLQSFYDAPINVKPEGGGERTGHGVGI